jgi:hypothetical protein
MLIHIVADHQHVLMILGGTMVGIVGPIPYDGISTGNPYLRFGSIIQEHLNVVPTETSVTVSRVTSGDLEKWVTK